MLNKIGNLKYTVDLTLNNRVVINENSLLKRFFIGITNSRSNIKNGINNFINESCNEIRESINNKDKRRIPLAQRYELTLTKKGNIIEKKLIDDSFHLKEQSNKPTSTVFYYMPDGKLSFFREPKGTYVLDSKGFIDNLENVYGININQKAQNNLSFFYELENSHQNFNAPVKISIQGDLFVLPLAKQFSPTEEFKVTHKRNPPQRNIIKEMLYRKSVNFNHIGNE